MALEADVIDIDGTVDVSGNNTLTGGGGGSGGSLKLTANRFIGKGKLLSDGGNAANYGGGGAAGRISIHTNESKFSGEISSKGGASFTEPGGAGTIYQIIKTGNKSFVSLTIDNGGQNPVDNHLVSGNQYDNGGKTWIPISSDKNLLYDELKLRNGAHVSFVSTIKRDVFIKMLTGDNKGMLHVKSGDHVIVESASTEFPSWFHVYEEGVLSLPKVVNLVKIQHSQLVIDGKLDGIEDIRIGPDITLLLGNKVHAVNKTP